MKVMYVSVIWEELAGFHRACWRFNSLIVTFVSSVGITFNFGNLPTLGKEMKTVSHLVASVKCGVTVVSA